MSSSRVRLLAVTALVMTLVAGAAAVGGKGRTELPSCPDEALEQARLLGAAGRQEDAALRLRRAIDDCPDHPELHFRLGYVLRYAGLFEESIAAYRRGLELDDRPAIRVAAEGQIAKALVYQGRYADALALQQRLHRHLATLGRDPDEKMLFYEGIMQLYFGDRDKAIALFDRAWEVDPTSLWSGFGQAYRSAARGDTAHVAALARELAARDVADGERHYRLVHFHALAGEEVEAVRRMRAAAAAGFFAYPYISADPLTAYLRGVPGFDEALAEIRSRHDTFAAGW